MNTLDMLEALSADGTDDVPSEFAIILERLIELRLVQRDHWGKWELTEIGRAMLDQKGAKLN